MRCKSVPQFDIKASGTLLESCESVHVINSCLPCNVLVQRVDKSNLSRLV